MDTKKSCCAGWCAACIACCCGGDEQGPDKYPYVKYSSPSDAQSSLPESQEFKLPLDKMKFEYTQPPPVFTIHPQMTKSISSDTDVVADQPRILRPLTFDQSGTSRESAPAELGMPSSFPTIQYSLYHNMQRNTLSVHLQQIYNLPAGNQKKSIDSFVSLYLLPHKEEEFESRVILKTLNPFFGQEFEFARQPSLELMKKQVLVFKVFENSRCSSAELLGVVTVKLDEADLFGETARTRIQQISVDVAKMDMMGEILLSLMYQPQANCLQGIILKAANFHKQDISVTADPYVRVCLFHKGKSVHQWKSTIKKNNIAPVFNEIFQFNIYNMDTNKMHLDIALMDYDKFFRDQVIGVVQIGSDIFCDRGRTHWEEIMSGSNEPISRWHQILPVSSEKEHAHTL